MARGRAAQGPHRQDPPPRGAPARPAGRAMTAPQDDGRFQDADAASALDLLLSDAALGVARRFLPSSSTVRFALGLARRPRTVARRGASLAGELASIAAGRS